MAKIETGPTKRDVERLLFRELNFNTYSGSSPVIKALDEEMEELSEKLLNVPEMRKLQAKRKALADEHDKECRRFKIKKEKVQRAFRAKGLVPSVLKMIEELVEDANSSKLFGESALTDW